MNKLPASLHAADATRPIAKSSMPEAGGTLCQALGAQSSNVAQLIAERQTSFTEQERKVNKVLSYSMPNGLAVGHDQRRAMPVNPAIVARQTAFTARGASAPRQHEDVK